MSWREPSNSPSDDILSRWKRSPNFPFGTLTEAIRFVEWYINHDCHTGWDDSRYEAALTELTQFIRRG